MKRICTLLLLMPLMVPCLGQTKAATTFNCNEIKYWQNQLIVVFKGINAKMDDETTLISSKKIAGFETCTYRKSSDASYTYADGTNNYTDKKAATQFYNKIKLVLKQCLTAQKYKVYPQEVEEEKTYQVSVKDYGTLGGYYQIRLEMGPAVTYENGKELPNGYEVSIVLELRKKGVAG